MPTLPPVLERELRMAARQHRNTFLRAGVAVGGFLIVLVALGNVVPGGFGIRGQMAFYWLTMLAFLVAYLSGSWLTASSISSEREQGTLGLLHLTPLRPWEVMLSKLAGAAIPLGQILLALLPMMAMTLLFGGVTFGELLLLFLALGGTALFSLNLGLFLSAASRDESHPNVSVLLVLLLLGCVYLLTGILSGGSGGFPELAALLRKLHPADAVLGALAGRYVASPGGFWASLVLSQLAGWTLFLLAMQMSRRFWKQDRPIRWQERLRERWQWIQFGSMQQREARRRRMDPNPVYWLASRSRGGVLVAWFLGLLPLVEILFIVLTQGRLTVPFVLGTAWAAGMVFKLLVAAAASRLVWQERRSGGLELLLASGVTPAQLLNGSTKALVRKFVPPLLAGWFCCLLSVLVLDYRSGFGITGLMVVAYGVLALADICTLGCVGLNGGLVCKSQRGAMLYTLLLGWVVPGIVAFLFAMPWLSASAGEVRQVLGCAVGFFLGSLFIYGLGRSNFVDHCRVMAAEPSRSRLEHRPLILEERMVPQTAG